MIEETPEWAHLIWIGVCLLCVGLWLNPPWYAYIPLFFVFSKVVRDDL